jgi:glucose/arabinose dehydrogenase
MRSKRADLAGKIADKSKSLRTYEERQQRDGERDRKKIADPRGGDELNRPEAGLNYGWPVVTYGIEYSGDPVGEGITGKPGTEQPVYYWDPVIGPSGMALYRGEEFPEWQNALLVGGLVSTGLVVLHMEGDRVAHEERVPLNARVRDVRVGPAGALYVLTEKPDAGTSKILRLTRAK